MAARSRLVLRMSRGTESRARESAMPGPAPGHSRIDGCSRLRSAATLGLPAARAGPVAAAPRAAAALAGEAAGAGCGVVAGSDMNRDGAVPADLARDADGGRA